MNDKIRDLEKQIEIEKNKIFNCKHVWGNVYNNPETIQEEYLTGEYENQGVHHHPLTAFRDKVIPRWTRVCEKCGKEEHTYEQEPITSYKPKFD